MVNAQDKSNKKLLRTGGSGLFSKPMPHSRLCRVPNAQPSPPQPQNFGASPHTSVRGKVSRETEEEMSQMPDFGQFDSKRVDEFLREFKQLTLAFLWSNAVKNSTSECAVPS